MSSQLHVAIKAYDISLLLVVLLIPQCTSQPHMETLEPHSLVVLKKSASSTSLASKDDTTDSARFARKFGKHIQKRQLEIPEYAASFVDYKALKKVVALSSAGA